MSGRPVGWRRAMRAGFTSPEARAGLAFVLPMLVLFAVFRIGPSIAGVVLSLFDWKITGAASFVGTRNFDKLFADAAFWKSLQVTLTFVLLSVPLVTTTALGMALLVARPVRWRAFFRAAFFLPYVTSLVMAGIIWTWIYGSEGMLASMLALVGVPQFDWLQQPATVLPAIAVMNVWKQFGYSMMVVLAGLLGIPRDYYEAAQIDGATPFQVFRSITLPLLKPALFFVVVIETISAFQTFDAVYVMTSGGPVRESYTLVYMLYDKGFKFFNFGQASAIGVVLFAMVLTVSLIQRWLLSSKA